MSEQAHIFEIKLYPENRYAVKSKLPSNSADIVPLLEARFDKYKWCWILHDKDKLKGQDVLCKPHVHFLVNATGTTISLDKIRRDYSISYANVYAKEDWVESVKYLLHRSKRAIGDSDKYKYPLADMHYNFNIDNIFAGQMKDVMDEGDILANLVNAYFEHSMSFLDLGKYASSIGQFGFYRKNVYLIDRCIKDEKEKILRMRNFNNGDFPY